MCGQPHHGGAQVCALEYDIPLDWLAFGVWLSMLLRCHGDRILRVEGILNVIDAEQPIVIHGVQHCLHPPVHLRQWPGQARRSRLVHIDSVWSPALMQLHREGIQYRQAVPRESYRGWLGGLSLSRAVEGGVKDAAYAYLNWWLAGWPGPMMARQGSYISNPLRARDHLSAAEWDYWYEGKPAREQLLGSDGEPLIEPGQLREGGAYAERVGRIRVWNSVMDEHNYLVRKWADFLRAGR
ncbi:hypothetical protein FYM84_25130 [Pseudomonas sp. CAH-1]|uniref:GTP-binding protein n=1 Tax=Pseudomonas juntendi TaxID=2666183 RepID=A0A7W2M135_9PSED|nr:GTP-binding protein [Pseudomonas juntendi]MBA6150710.1 GTP-binding protein [Pseudomonas juntendi]MRT63840.1 hypothetical protein [Pseudomonas sp. CAH-1]NPA21882.1 hypothetical protein [Gammaproteobacteria bacterium]QOH69592.1 GTP-binding protein [Pseudomonas putida]